MTTRPLLARPIVEDRNVWRSLEEIRDAEREFNEACRTDDTLRHARRLPKGQPNSWIKTWEQEVVPARILCEHRGLNDAQLRLAPPNTPATDVFIRTNGREERVEITVAYAARHDNWQIPGRASPGAQEALRAEMLNREGWVSATDPLTRNPSTRQVEYESDEGMRAPEDAIPEWTNGLRLTLEGKRRGHGYGAGSILAVYGYGLSGDFEPPRHLVRFDEILAQIPNEAIKNDFDRTFIFGWHERWCRELTVR